MGDVISPPAAPNLGIICGLQSEAATLNAPDGTLIGISGARPGKASAEARRLVDAGADMLVSFGLAGALTSEFAPGDLIIPEQVTDEAGRHWRCQSLPDEVFPGAHRGRLLGAETVIDTPAAKSELARQHKAVAVDMESQRVAEVAAAANLPFIVVRAIADPAHRALPPLARNAVDETGAVRLGATIWGLARRPWDLSGLLALGGDSKAAHRTLSRAAAALWKLEAKV